MRELNSTEINQVSGGLDLGEGGLALIGVGLGAFGLGPVGLGVFAISAGTTMILGDSYLESRYDSYGS